MGFDAVTTEFPPRTKGSQMEENSAVGEREAWMGERVVAIRDVRAEVLKAWVLKCSRDMKSWTAA